MRYRRAAFLLLGATAGPLAGCGGLGIPSVSHAVSLADRCADIVTTAVPFEIDIKTRTSVNAGIDKIVAGIEAVRSDLPKGSPAVHAFAAECEFTGGMLSAFRWTKGGPPTRP